MTPLALYQQLRKSGMDEATALSAASHFEADELLKAEARYEALLDRLNQHVETASDRKKVRDRERMAAKREAEKLERQSRDIARHRATIETSGDNGDGKDAPAPPRTRVEDNPLRLVNIPNLTILESASAPDLDWPETDKPSRAYLDQLQAALTDAAGQALASIAVCPKLASLAPILALGRPGKGPVCDLQADVLPTIWARSAKAAPRSVKSWDFYTDAIRENRDRRLAGAPAVEPFHQGQRHERPEQNSPKRAAREDNLARAYAASEAVAGGRAVG